MQSVHGRHFEGRRSISVAQVLVAQVLVAEVPLAQVPIQRVDPPIRCRETENAARTAPARRFASFDLFYDLFCDLFQVNPQPAD
jgi:hypothetical protein